MLAGIALGLGVPECTFEQPEVGGTTSETSYWVSRVIYYPPLIQGSSQLPDNTAGSHKTVRANHDHGEIERSVQLSCGEHTDYGLLTLVNQEDHVSALQVWEWPLSKAGRRHSRDGTCRSREQ